MADQLPIPLDDRPPSARLSRRAFLRIVAGVGIAGLVGRGALESIEASRVVHQTRLLMGTMINLTLVVPDRETAAAESAITDCMSSMAELEAVLSRFIPDSQVSTLNRTGAINDPHPALLELVRQSRSISELSAGLFDITILPVLALYQKYQAQAGDMPPAAEIEAACCKVDYRLLTASEDSLVLSTPGMGITLDGIAKGYITDVGVSRLIEHGFTDVLVESGGDLVASGLQSLDHPWKIGIQSPRPVGEPLVAQINAFNEAVATSGDYMQPFASDFSNHHILNPRTGYSSPVLASATVIAPCLALADALATTLMLMDPHAGLALARELGVRAILVTKDLTVYQG